MAMQGGSFLDLMSMSSFSEIVKVTFYIFTDLYCVSAMCHIKVSTSEYVSSIKFGSKSQLCDTRICPPSMKQYSCTGADDLQSRNPGSDLFKKFDSSHLFTRGLP